MINQLFKDKILLLEENLDDPLTGALRVKNRPQVSWYKDMYTHEVEDYSGKIDRTSLSLWMQERARRRLATPAKTVRELTRTLSSEVCNREDNNYCVVAFYRSDKGKAEATKLLQSGAQKYNDDPVTFYTVNKSSLKAACPIEQSADEPFVVIFRTKRRKFDIVEGNLLSKIDSVLSGSPLHASMTADFSSCFV